MAKRISLIYIGIAASAAVLVVLCLVGRLGLARRNETFLNQATAACKEGRYEDAARLLGLIRSYPFFLVSRGDTVSKSLEDHVRDSLQGHMQLKGESSRMSVEVNDIVDWLLRNGYAALAGGITNESIQHAFDVAMAAGAEAGKVSGAGGGGFIIFFTAPENRKRVEEALKTLDGFVMPFLFTDGGAHGWKIFDTDTAVR